jgi:hypothetical protein
MIFRDFECVCHLNKVCAQFCVEQKLFFYHLMKMARSCSNMTYKLKLEAVLELRIFLSLELHSSSRYPTFVALYLSIHAVLA